MLGKRARPPVRRSPAPEPIIPAERAGFSDVATSPRSPTKWKNHESEGVGLGIVAALEKKSGEIPARFVVGSLNLGRSDPIPVGSGKNPARFAGGSEMVCSESYTCVITHGVKSSVTRVYCGEKEGKDSKRNGQFGNFGVFWASPPSYTEEISCFPTSDFLSCCYLCRKKLHGKDIYMYRGEKAFCSSECRYRQIVNDERKEKCRSEAPKSSDISVSSYSENRLFCVVAA